ncbi:MAG: hypothetical protein U1E65_36470 [Myxococcota bacterium]
MRWVPWLALLAAGCTERQILRAPLSADPALIVRVAIVKNGQDVSATVLTSTGSVSFEVAAGGADVWDLGFARADFQRFFPPAGEPLSSAEAASQVRVSLTPGYNVLGPPSRVLHAAITGESDAAPLRSSSLEEVQSWLSGLGLGLTISLDPSVICANVHLDTFPLPPMLKFGSLAAVDDEVTYVGAIDVDGPFVGRFDARTQELKVLERGVGANFEVAYDVTTSLLYVVDTSSVGAGAIRTFDVEGHIARLPPGGPSGRITSWSLGVDGTLFASDGPRLTRYSGGQWTDLAPPDLAPVVTSFFGVKADLYFGVVRPNLFVHTAAGWGAAIFTDVSPHWFSADADQPLVLTGGGERVLAWRGGPNFLELPMIPNLRWQVALAADRHRVAMSGSRGAFGVLLRGAFCRLEGGVIYEVLRGSAPLHGSAAFFSAFKSESDQTMFRLRFAGEGPE